MFCLRAGFRMAALYAILFLTPYLFVSQLLSFLIPFTIWYLLHPLCLLLFTITSIASFNIHSLIIQCPSQFFFVLKTFNICFCSPIFLNIFSLLTLSTHFIVSSLLHIHISKVSNLLSSSFLSAHILPPCSTALHTKCFTNLFLRALSKHLCKSILPGIRLFSSDNSCHDLSCPPLLYFIDICIEYANRKGIYMFYMFYIFLSYLNVCPY